MEGEEAEVPCSFCGKNEDETARLIAGPGELRICSECVHLCAEIVNEDPPAPSVVQETTLVLEDGARHVVASGLHEAARNR